MPIHGIRATYQPFSFQERLAPLQMMKEEYDKINEGISTLGEASNQYYQFLDPETKKVVDQYNATLQQVAGDMSANGMKAVSRNTLNALRRQYSSQILPIQQAAQTYSTMQAQVNEMAMKDPTLMIQSMPTVRDIMADPSARPHVISGSQLEKEGMAAALQLPGVDYSTISRYLNGDTSAIPDLNASVQQIAQTYGVSDEQALGYISRGIISGLGQRATSLYDAEQQIKMKEESEMRLTRFKTGQQAYLDNLRTANDIRAARETSRYSSRAGNGSSGSSSKRGQNIYTTTMITKRDHDTVVKRFMKNGNIEVSDKLFKNGKLSKPGDLTYGANSGAAYVGNKDSREYNDLIKVLGNYYSSDQIASMNKQQVEQALNAIAGNESMDVQGANQYVWYLDQNATKQLVNRINNGHDVRKVKDRDSSGEFIFGKETKLDKASENETSEIRLDPISGRLLLLRNGEYYDVPLDVLPNELIGPLSDYTKIGSDGMTKQRKMEIALEEAEKTFNSLGVSPEDIIYAAQDAQASGTKLSPEVTEYVNLALDYFKVLDEYQDMDNVFGSVGNVLNSYTGTMNTNK